MRGYANAAGGGMPRRQDAGFTAGRPRIQDRLPPAQRLQGARQGGMSKKPKPAYSESTIERLQGARQGGMSKGQLWSLDFVASVVIFLSAVTLLFFSWDYTSTQGRSAAAYQQAEAAALSVSDALIRLPGEPASWTAGNVEIIGLAKSEYELARTQTLNFVQMNYTIAKQRLGLSGYEYAFNVTMLNGTLIKDGAVDLAAGLNPANATIIVPIERFVIYRNAPAKVKLIVWK